MKLHIPIALTDELSDDIIEATGKLDMASGDITDVVYEDYDLEKKGLPARLPDYEFTCGVMSNRGRDVEFKVDVDRASGRYSVSADELEEIKKRAAALFAAAPGKA